MDNILIIDDEKSLLELLSVVFKREGYGIRTALSAQKAFEIMDKENVDLIVTDIKMPKTNGMDVLKHVKTIRPDVPVVMITAYGSINQAVEALKAGALDYVVKPFDVEELKIIVGRGLAERRLKQENLRLEGIIEERTAEIRKQKEELTDSIEYASRIQRALLPSDRLMEDLNIEHFILFRPRDIVSGDFYWMGTQDDKVLIVAADCTGHGVPGAFMSMLGMTFLDEIVIKSEITETDQIMESLRDHVIASLEQSGKSQEEAVKDGMDLAMISVDLKSRMIQYSGAYNPLYLVRKLKRNEITRLKNGEELDLPRGSIHDSEHLLIQIRADQMPIGFSEKEMLFNATTIKDEGYNIYMFSDGFLDQFGGPQGKKFMSKNFKKLLLELQSIPLKEQGAALEKVLLGWMGEISQIDDILVMGLRMNPL